MRILMGWENGYDSPAFHELTKYLNIEYCGFFGDHTDTAKSSAFIELEKILIFNNTVYEGWAYAKKNLHFSKALEHSTIEEMKKYEGIAMEIIFRWRKTLTADYSISNLKTIYYDYLRYWDEYLSEKKIDCLVLPNIPHIPTFFICYALCKVKDIPVVVRIRLPVVKGQPQIEYLTTSLEKVGIDFEHEIV